MILNRCGIQGNSLFYFISLTGCYYKQSMLHSAVNISFNLLIFFPASPKSYFMILSLFPFQNMRYHYNTIKQKKKKKPSDLWNQSQHFIFITYFFTTLDIHKDFNGYFWLLNQRKDSTRRTSDFTVKKSKSQFKSQSWSLVYLVTE